MATTKRRARPRSNGKTLGEDGWIGTSDRRRETGGRQHHESVSGAERRPKRDGGYAAEGVCRYQTVTVPAE